MFVLFRIFKGGVERTKDLAKSRIKKTLSFDRSSCEEVVKSFRDEVVTALAGREEFEADMLDVRWSENDSKVLVLSVPVKMSKIMRKRR